MHMRSSLLTLSLITVLAACGDKDDSGGSGDDGGVGDGGTDGGTDGDGGGTDGDGGTDGGDSGSTDGGDDTGGGGDGGTGSDPIDADIDGKVTVVLIETQDDGDVVEVPWADTPWADSDWPFGSIFVAAAQSDGEGDVFYRGDTVIRSPSFEGDAYNLDVSLPEAGEVNLIARLDMRGDGFIDSWDPTGVHGNAIDLADGDELDGRNITITLDYATALSWWTGGGGGGGGGGTGCDDVQLSGTAELGAPWATGRVAVMLYNSDGTGPVAYDYGDPTPSGDGESASMAWNIPACENAGDYDLRGAWDSNANGLIDPADLWGTWVEDEADANPLIIESSDLSDLTVEIPFGDGRSGLGVAPFVLLSGNVTYSTGSFGEFPEDSVLYVSALLFKPAGEFAVSELAERGYGTEVYAEEDWSTVTELPFELWVPSSTTVYVFANVDEGPEPDGILGQPFDWVGAAGGEYAGWVPTGTRGDDDINIDLAGGEPPVED